MPNFLSRPDSTTVMVPDEPTPSRGFVEYRGEAPTRQSEEQPSRIGLRPWSPSDSSDTTWSSTAPRGVDYVTPGTRNSSEQLNLYFVAPITGQYSFRNVVNGGTYTTTYTAGHNIYRARDTEVSVTRNSYELGVLVVSSAGDWIYTGAWDPVPSTTTTFQDGSVNLQGSNGPLEMLALQTKVNDLTTKLEDQASTIQTLIDLLHEKGIIG